jgi:hypothetical protein
MGRCRLRPEAKKPAFIAVQRMTQGEGDRGQVSGASPRRAGPIRRGARRVLMPVVAVAAILYFLIDALFLWFVRPIARWLGRLRILEGVRNWVRSLGPYPTLALFLVPLIILEPVKPVALYLFSTGHFMPGTLVLVIGELLKLTLVERLFHLGKDKLMSIAAFAWAYGWVTRWLGYLRSLPPWQSVLRLSVAIKARARLVARAVAALSRRITGGVRRRWTAFWIDPA